MIIVRRILRSVLTAGKQKSEHDAQAASPVTPIKEDANFLVSGPRQGCRSFAASRLKTYPAFVAAQDLLSSEAQ